METIPEDDDLENGSPNPYRVGETRKRQTIEELDEFNDDEIRLKIGAGGKIGDGDGRGSANRLVEYERVHLQLVDKQKTMQKELDMMRQMVRDAGEENFYENQRLCDELVQIRFQMENSRQIMLVEQQEREAEFVARYNELELAFEDLNLDLERERSENEAKLEELTQNHQREIQSLQQKHDDDQRTMIEASNQEIAKVRGELNDKTYECIEISTKLILAREENRINDEKFALLKEEHERAQALLKDQGELAQTQLKLQAEIQSLQEQLKMSQDNLAEANSALAVVTKNMENANEEMTQTDEEIRKAHDICESETVQSTKTRDVLRVELDKLREDISSSSSSTIVSKLENEDIPQTPRRNATIGSFVPSSVASSGGMVKFVLNSVQFDTLSEPEKHPRRLYVSLRLGKAKRKTPIVSCNADGMMVWGHEGAAGFRCSFTFHGLAENVEVLIRLKEQSDIFAGKLKKRLLGEYRMLLNENYKLSASASCFTLIPPEHNTDLAPLASAQVSLQCECVAIAPRPVIAPLSTISRNLTPSASLFRHRAKLPVEELKLLNSPTN